MKFPLVSLPTLLLVCSVVADKRVRPFSFQRQTASSTEKPESGPYPPSGWKPEKPQTSTESGPYPPSGWKPNGPQFEVGPPPKKPDDNATSAPDSGASNPESNNDSAPAKLVSFVQPENIVYYVLPSGKLQEVVIAPENVPFLTRASYRRVEVARPLQLQVVDSPIVEVARPQVLTGTVYSFSSPLVRVFRKA